MRRRRLWAALLAPLLSGCGELELYHICRYEPIRTEVTAALAGEHAALQTCLDRLGAPHQVWEAPEGLVLGYAWLDKVYWKFDVTIRFSGVQGLDGRTVFSYNQTNDAYQGAVLVFDDDLRLAIVRHGMLADISRPFRRRPTAIE